MTKTLLFAAAALLVTGCNEIAGLTKKQADAVTAAVIATCDRYAACDEIGSGKTYETRADCEGHARDFWNDQWPVVDCDGKIDGSALNVCTNRISSTSCDNFLDQLNTAFNQCSKSEVCSG